MVPHFLFYNSIPSLNRLTQQTNSFLEMKVED